MNDLVSPHRKGLLLAMALNLVVGISVTFQNLLPKFIMDDALLKEGLDLEQRRQRLFLFALLYVFVGIVLRAGVWHGSLRIFGRIRERCVSRLRSRFFNHVNRLCISFHNRHNSGELFSYLFGSPLTHVQQYYSLLALMLPHEVVSLTLTLVFLGSWDLLLTGVILISICVHFLVQIRARLLIREIQHDFQKTEAKVSGKVADMLRGHRAMKLYAVEESADRDFGRELDIIHDKSYWREIRSHLQQIKQESVLYIGYASLSILAGWRFLGGHITEGQLTAYLTSYIALQGPLRTFFQLALLRGSSQASLERMAALLTTESSTPDPETGVADVPLRGEIVFDHVTFGYGEEPVLSDVSLTIPFGQKVALVGPSGAGKSTIAQLILRLYDPQQGRILFNGIDIRSFSGSALRRRFGVVPQDPYMFNCSIRDNLTLVDPDADDAKLREVCEQANAWEFIEDLPQGLDTMLGEGGCTVSGGQRQRLAIARALLMEPSFFVFDEATSALDTLSEERIRDAMSRVTEGRTALFIAHRLASVENCDRILVLENGRITQDGSYAELAAAPGMFRDLLRTQNVR
ncbi:MAG: ABC transporter ATP-binding protein [Verrucomicrobia bacterium]|nr:ABC transporter ATP-binding protein [Verrucomicrobiota bacterium]MCH8528019.1 ABC transporter ATP-binding protein/permease [Kiritimatiellia bacterium]